MNIVQNLHAVVVELLNGISLEIEDAEVGEPRQMLDFLHVVDEIVLQVDGMQQVVILQTREPFDLVPRQIQLLEDQKRFQVFDFGNAVSLNGIRIY